MKSTNSEVNPEGKSALPNNSRKRLNKERRIKLRSQNEDQKNTLPVKNCQDPSKPENRSSLTSINRNPSEPVNRSSLTSINRDPSELVNRSSLTSINRNPSEPVNRSSLTSINRDPSELVNRSSLTSINRNPSEPVNRSSLTSINRDPSKPVNRSSLTSINRRKKTILNGAFNQSFSNPLEKYGVVISFIQRNLPPVPSVLELFLNSFFRKRRAFQQWFDNSLENLYSMT
ncbi:uncharacterized protein [Centruroides vittatus]|uniref:uncharacterized protein n=1 Tax=Centruroides vittatus TaxID=120091 RepID=UPI00350F4413